MANTAMKQQIPSEPTIHELGLSNKSFNEMRSGQQTVEGRAYKDGVNYFEFEPGDIIQFSNNETNETLRVKVERVTQYSSVEAMLKAEGVNNCEPNAESFEAAVQAYNSIEDYPERIKRGGIFAIKFELIPEVH